MPFSIAWTWKTEFVVTWRQKIYWKKCFFVRRERNSESEIIGLASEGKKPLRLREGQLTRSSGHVCFGSASRVSFSHSTRLHSHDFTNAPDLSLVKKWSLINSSAHWRILSFQRFFIVHDVCNMFFDQLCSAHLSKAKPRQLRVDGVRASSFEKSHLATISRTRLSIIPGLSPACCHYHHHHRLALLIEPHFCRIFRHCLYSQKSCWNLKK